VAISVGVLVYVAVAGIMTREEKAEVGVQNHSFRGERWW
jgi:hypothetical protein